MSAAPRGRLEKGEDDRPARHRASPSCRTSRSSRRSTTTARCSSSASARWRSSPRACEIDFRDERGERLRDELPVRRRHRRLRQVPAQPGHARPAAPEGRLPGGLERQSARSRSRCSGTTPTRRPCSRSPTTSTRTRAARTCPASAPRSPARINAYARQAACSRRRTTNLQGEDVREGLTAIISVKIHDPQFEGQTKTKLGNPPVEGFVQAAVNKGLAEFLEENPAEARQVDPQGRRGGRARDAARKARDLTRRKSALENSTLPGKLADCSVTRSRRSRRSSSSRATRPAAPPSRAATATPRRSCRCAARSSTSRRTASTRCSRTRRSRR